MKTTLGRISTTMEMIMDPKNGFKKLKSETGICKYGEASLSVDAS